MRRTEAAEALEQKLARDRAALLSASEVRILAREVQRVAQWSLDEPSLASRVEDAVRWASLRARCQQARGQRGLGIRHVAVQLQLPQYRLRAIENGHLSEFRSDVARRYFRFLEIEAWVAQWCKANRRLARRLGLGGTHGRDDRQKRSNATGGLTRHAADGASKPARRR